MNFLGNGLFAAGHVEEALRMEELFLSTLQRVGAPEDEILMAQSNLATTYRRLGRLEEALRMRRDAYYGCVKLKGEEDSHFHVMIEAKQSTIVSYMLSLGYLTIRNRHRPLKGSIGNATTFCTEFR